MDKKAQSEVIAVLLILAISVAAVAVAYRWAVPRVQESQDKSRIDSITNFLEELDRKIREVSNSGEGSQRFIEIEFDKGQFLIHPPPDNNILYQLVSYTIESIELPLSKNLPYGSYLRVRQNEENQDIIELILEYTDIEIEAEVPGSEELVLPPKTYNIFIRNMGGNIVRLSRRAAYIGTTERFLLSGYVYDNSSEAYKDLSVHSWSYQPNGDYIKEDQEIIPNAEILVLDSQGNVITSTRANSYGKYALLLQRRVTAEMGQYYFVVNRGSYAMKEYSAVDGTNIQCDKYAEEFNSTIITGWNFDQDPYKEREEIRIDFPLYKIKPPDILENTPMAIIVDHVNPMNKGIVYDIRAAMDSDPATYCKYFIVYGNVTVPNTPEPVVDANFKYPGTSDPIYVYPVEWLLDPDQVKALDEGYLLPPYFEDLPAIGGEENKIDYHDFALIAIGTGAIQDGDLNDNLMDYRDTFSNFVSLGKFSFNGIDYARGLVAFPQILGYGSYDPLLWYGPEPSSGVTEPPSNYYDAEGVELSSDVMGYMSTGDGEPPIQCGLDPDLEGEFQQKYFRHDFGPEYDYGYDDERYGNNKAYAWLPEFLGDDLRLTCFTGVTNWDGMTSGTLNANAAGIGVIQATAEGKSVQVETEFFERIVAETHYVVIGANGVDTSLITATVRDENGVLMDAENVTFTTDAGIFIDNMSNSYTVATTNGIATATLESGTSEVTAIVTIELTSDPIVYGTVEVDFATGLVFRDTAESDTYIDGKIYADGVTTATLTATVVMPGSPTVPIQGTYVYFSSTGGSLSDISGTTDANGNCPTTLTSDVTPQDVTVTSELRLYDNGEWIYKDNDTDDTVSDGDTRLTEVVIDSTTYLAGTDVNGTTPDLDVGLDLQSFNPYEKYYDADISTNYTDGEPIYGDIDGSNDVSAGDYRITSSGVYSAGTYVEAGDTDIGNALTPFAADEKFVNSTSNLSEDVTITCVGDPTSMTVTSKLSKIPVSVYHVDDVGDHIWDYVFSSKITATVRDGQGVPVPSYMVSKNIEFTSTAGTIADTDQSTAGYQYDVNTDENGQAVAYIQSFEDEFGDDGFPDEDDTALPGSATVYVNTAGIGEQSATLEFVPGICFTSYPVFLEVGENTAVNVRVYDTLGQGKAGIYVDFSLTPAYLGYIIPDDTSKKYNFYEVHRTRGGAFTYRYWGLFWDWVGWDDQLWRSFDEGTFIDYDHQGAHGTYTVTRDWWFSSVSWPFNYDISNTEITGYVGSKIFPGLGDQDYCVHGYFDITNTDWDIFNIAAMENDVPTRDYERHSSIFFGIFEYVVRYTIYGIEGGPTMLIKEHKDEYDEMIQCVIITAMDFDRYNNTAPEDPQAPVTHGDLDVNIRAGAKTIEKNMILYAIGYEDLITT